MNPVTSTRHPFQAFDTFRDELRERRQARREYRALGQPSKDADRAREILTQNLYAGIRHFQVAS